MLCLSHQDQFKISIAQSPISPLGPLTADSGLYGEAFGVFFEAQTVSMQPVLKRFFRADSLEFTFSFRDGHD